MVLEVFKKKVKKVYAEVTKEVSKENNSNEEIGRAHV